MRAYVLGAGASHPIYPLGSNLFAAIDLFIDGCGPCINRFDYQKDWPELKRWLELNSNPLLSQAFRNGNIEQIFTVLDLAESLISESLTSILAASKRGAAEVQRAGELHHSFASEIVEYRDVRSKLLWAMEAYFLQRNYEDAKEFQSGGWDHLKRFGRLLESGDIVVTFNYDSTVERVLLAEAKWAPGDGYGFEVAFQENRHDETPVQYPPSDVKVLHLHGAIGWYRKPAFNSHFHPVKEGGGSIPRSALAPGAIQTEIAIDPLFLSGLGIYHVDAALPQRPPREEQLMIHPSFLKEYSGEGDQIQVFNKLWGMAASSLRNASEVVIIGYSLPPADSAAWTLIHTACDRQKTLVVNPSKSVLQNRYWPFLKQGRFTENIDFAAWLDSKGD